EIHGAEQLHYPFLSFFCRNVSRRTSLYKKMSCRHRTNCNDAFRFQCIDGFVQGNKMAEKNFHRIFAGKDEMRVRVDIIKSLLDIGLLELSWHNSNHGIMDEMFGAFKLCRICSQI